LDHNFKSYLQAHTNLYH